MYNFSIDFSVLMLDAFAVVLCFSFFSSDFIIFMLVFRLLCVNCSMCLLNKQIGITWSANNWIHE